MSRGKPRVLVQGLELMKKLLQTRKEDPHVITQHNSKMISKMISTLEKYV